MRVIAAGRSFGIAGVSHSTVLEEDFTLSLPTGTVPASRYQAFVEKVQAIDDGFMAGTRIRVK